MDGSTGKPDLKPVDVLKSAFIPKSSAPPFWQWILLFIFSLGLLTFGLQQLTRDNNLGIDYYIYYVGGRTLFKEGGSPYSDAVAEQVQMAVLKRLALPGEDQVGFAYPPHALLPVLPTLWLPYDWASALWLAFGVLALVGAMAAFRRVPRWAPVSLLFIYPFSFALLTGNFNVLIAAVLLLSFGLLGREQELSKTGQVLMGVLLAYATVKPQFAWLFIVFFLLWTLQRRWWAWLGGFAGGMLAMLIFSFATMPNWLPAWMERLQKYSVYNRTQFVSVFLLRDFLPLNAAWWVTGVLGAMALAVSAWLFLRWWRGKTTPIQLLAWCGLVGFLFNTHGQAYEQIIFLLPMLVWVCTRQYRKQLPVLVFWWGGLALSWMFFFLSRIPDLPPGIRDWQFLFYIVWLAVNWKGMRSSLPM
jgi:hypothetical protein